MNLLDLPEQSTTLSSSPAWKAFWTADKYLTCRPVHGKYSLQSSYFRFPNVYFRFLQLKGRAVSAGLLRTRRKRRYPWGGLHLCPRRGFLAGLQCGTGCFWLPWHKCVVTPEAWTRTSAQIHCSGSGLCRVSDYSCTTLPGLWQGSSWEALHSLHFSHSTFINFTDRAKKSFFQCARRRESRIQLDSIYNISDRSTNYQFTPRSGGHQQDLTDLRGRKYCGWIIPTKLPQAELPVAKLYFLSWTGHTAAQISICISV